MTIANLAMRNEANPNKWWLNDSNLASTRSPWLQYSLGELERKTKAMLKVIEEDADSFAQRAEMYYKKRPELINMVEDFYRTHRSLVEQYDQLKSETGGSRRRLLSLASSLSVDFDRGRRPTRSMMMGDHQAFDCKLTMNVMGGDDHHQAYDCKSTVSGMGDDDHHEASYDYKSTTSGGTGDDDQVYDFKSTMSGGMDDHHCEASYDYKSSIGMDDHRCEASYDYKSTTSHSDICNLDDDDSGAESEVDDPELEDDDGQILAEDPEQNSFTKAAAAADEMKREYEERLASQTEEMNKLKEELEQLKAANNIQNEELEQLKAANKIQNEELSQKDEEKREVIRQLSIGMELLRSENTELRKKQQQQYSSPAERRSPGVAFFTKLFQRSPPISMARIPAAIQI